MQIEWVRFDRERYNPNALAAVRQGAREGTLLDVAADTIFIGLLLRNLAQTLTVEENGLKLEFRPTSKFAGKAVRQPRTHRLARKRTFSSSVLVDSDYVVKLFRKLENGINPAIEIGRYLTDVAGFANTPAMLGSAELIEADARNAIAIVHVQVGNQGDAWTMTASYLDRLLEEQQLLAADGENREGEEQIAYMRHLSQIGRRAAELHLALASANGSPDLTAEPVEPHDVARWTAAIAQSAERGFQGMKQRRHSFGENERAMIDELLAQQDNLHDRLERADAVRNTEYHHASARRLQSRTGADRQGRRVLHRLRRRCPPATRGAPAQGARGPRRRQHDLVDRGLEPCRARPRPYLAPDDHGRLGKALTEWVERATAAFMGAYREAMTNSPIWPADFRAMQRTVDFSCSKRLSTCLKPNYTNGGSRAGGDRPHLADLSQPAREAA